MKKILIIIAIFNFILLILLTGCGSQEVADYNKRLNAWNNYFTQVADLSVKADETNRNLIENFELAIDNTDKIPYAKMLLYNYQEQYNNASEIQVPNIAIEVHKHYIDYLKQNIEACSCIINDDSSGYEKAARKAFEEYTESFNKMIKIWEDFDKEAEKLNLPKPSGIPEV